MRAISGLQLSERFYWEAVRPLLDQHFGALPHAAALLGDGSEVLGYDDSTSTDHHWGPHVSSFVQPADCGVAAPLHTLLAERLPAPIWRLSHQLFAAGRSRPRRSTSGGAGRGQSTTT